MREMRRSRSRIGQVIGSTYVLITAIVVAATALAYYSYEYAHQMASRGRQSIIESTREVGLEKVGRIETLIVNSDLALFNLVGDLANLNELPKRWSEIAHSSPTVESVIVIDEHLHIAPDGFVSKKHSRDADAFRQLFEKRILPELDLGLVGPDDHKHLHMVVDDRSYLFSYTRRDVHGEKYYVVLEGDIFYLLSDVFWEELGGNDGGRLLYQVVDDQDNLIFGRGGMPKIPRDYLVSLPFSQTLSRWTLRIAPRDVPAIVARESARRATDFVLIGLSAVTLFVGLGILTYAVRTERRASALKSDFIANVSHELKTPLSLIRMFGELLASGRTKGADSAREYAEIITREAERLSRLIDNVLDFARIERGKVAYEFKIGDLSDVISRALDIYRYRLDREHMKLKVEIEPDLPHVKIDENAMTLVLLNLVDNAVKYAAEGKELTVSLAHEEDRILLKVADQGPGIHLDERDRIFERFYRSRTVRGRPVRGSGIGLSLVKHIAEAHGGGVYVESSVGKGSTFVVWLPQAPQAEVVATVEATA